jgi:cytochrome c553
MVCSWIDKTRSLLVTRIVAAVGAVFLLAGADAGPGEAIYRQQCAECHGASGEGTEDNPKPLAGDKSVAQLSKLIARTMPEDDPGTCVGEDADRVAAYIHEAFYTKNAKAAAKAPRIEVSRLTVRQYRNAVADLIGSFRGTGNWDEKHGLHGEYFRSRRFRGNDRVIERVDPTVSFDFGEGGPEPDKFDAREFSIRWDGSVLAPETGEYEFIVRTEHATRLWVNDQETPLIDALVKSGDDTEYRASIYLLGGRVYPLKLEFSKAKQGVDDSKTKKQPPPAKASIALAWKLPNRTDEIIPERNLTPNRFPELYVCTTPFPPDDRSVGYERGTSVSKAWDGATTDAAIETANYVAEHLRDLTGVPNDASDRGPRLRNFFRQFAERASRRPVHDENKLPFVDRIFAQAGDPELAAKRVVLYVLKSPRFLYRETGGETPDPYEVASRLSFALWDSLPDGPLYDAAAQGRLAKPEEIRAQAERMVTDLRTKSKLRSFFLQWLKVEQVPDIGKDPALFPDFNESIASDLRTSLDLFLEEVVWGEASDFRQLLLSDQIYLNGRLAKFYGADLPENASFQKVSLNPEARAGVLSHPYLMTTFAYTGTSSPIHRGVFLARSVLGRGLKPPPEAVAPLAPDLHAELSTRDRVTLQTKPAACITCHGMINPLGFSLEYFDAVGRFRGDEKGKPIDATGLLEGRDGATLPYNGARELAAVLVESEEPRIAFVEQLFHNLVKQPVRAYGPDMLPDLTRSFSDHQFNIRHLIVEIVARTAPAARNLKP